MAVGAAQRQLAGTMSVPLGAIAVNGLAYLLLLLAARHLSHAAYGEFATALGVLLIGSIPALALQTVVARRVAAHDRTDGIGATTVLLSAGSAVALAALVVPLDRFLHFSSASTLLWTAAALVGTTVFGPLLGHAQGTRRFGALAGLTLAQGVGRSGGGLVGLMLGATPATGCAGIAAGMTVTAAVGAVAARPTVQQFRPPRTPRRDPAALREVFAECARAIGGHGSFLLVASLDLVLARHVLAANAAGVYAAGTVVERGALWLPQSIGLLVFARLAEHRDHHQIVRRTGLLIAGIGLALTAVVGIAGHLVVVVIGGDYGRLTGIAWLFALVGTAQALAQFAMLAGLALRRARRVVVLWLVVAAEIACVLALGADSTPTRVVTLTAVITVLGAGALFAVAATDRSTRRTVAVGPPTDTVVAATPVPPPARVAMHHAVPDADAPPFARATAPATTPDPPGGLR